MGQVVESRLEGYGESMGKWDSVDLAGIWCIGANMEQWRIAMNLGRYVDGL